MPDEKTGQEAGSPPAGEGDQLVNQDADPTKIIERQGQENADSPGSDDDKGAAEDKGGVEGKDYVVVDGKRYYSSFDTHPEWRELKDARDGFNDLLEQHGYRSKEELISDLESGVDLKSVIGERDANELVEAANKWAMAEEYWAEQEAKQQHEGESDEEKAARLERENAELKKAQREEKLRAEEIRESQAALKTFASEVDVAIEDAKLGKDAAEIARLYFGVNNPMDAVDVTNKKSMRLAINDGMKKFGTFVEAIKQAAIDEYADGKSDITPLPKDKGGGSNKPPVTGRAFELKEGETAEQGIMRANQQLIETLNKMGKEQ